MLPTRPALFCRLDGVKQLHIILLAVTLVLGVLFLALLYRPYIKALKRDSRAVVNLLSQLPAEVDVEGIVKTAILGAAANPAGAAGADSKDAGCETLPHVQKWRGPAMAGAWGGDGRPAGPDQRVKAWANDSQMYGYETHKHNRAGWHEQLAVCMPIIPTATTPVGEGPSG